MEFARPTIEKYIGLCDKYGTTQKELAMDFALSVPGVSSIVVGCRTVEQVLGNCGIYENRHPLNADELNEIHEMFSGTDRQITIPMLWPKN